MWKILEILASSLGATGCLVILGFILKNWFIERLKGSIKHEYAIDLEEHKNNLKRKTDAELASLNGQVSIEVEKAKLKMSFYSEKQFDLYNELWVNLWELKVTMNELWSAVNQNNLLKFQNQLLKTDDLLEKRAVLIEPQHYEELRKILSEFGHYRLGKRSLYELRQEQDEIRNCDIVEIQHLTDSNRRNRDALSQYLPQMRDCLRKQICGQSGK